MKKLVILASGSGSNAEQIIRYFENHSEVKVREVLSNKTGAGVLDRAERLGVPHATFSRADMLDPEVLLGRLKAGADYIILAGFLWKIPEFIVQAFPDRILNIHPALLPKFGGKGM